MLIFGMMLFSAPLLAEGTLRNNVDRMKQAIDSTAAVCARRFHFRPGVRIEWIEQETGDPVHQFILARFAAALAWNGIHLTLPPGPRSENDRFILSVVKAGISYKRASSNRPEARSSVNRIVEIRVAARFFRSDSVSIDTVSVRLEDGLRRSDLRSVEQGGELLGRPERPSPGFLVRVLEPALVVTSLGWMVYSFYSIRSQ